VAGAKVKGGRDFLQRGGEKSTSSLLAGKGCTRLNSGSWGRAGGLGTRISHKRKEKSPAKERQNTCGIVCVFTWKGGLLGGDDATKKRKGTTMDLTL